MVRQTLNAGSGLHSCQCETWIRTLARFLVFFPAKEGALTVVWSVTVRSNGWGQWTFGRHLHTAAQVQCTAMHCTNALLCLQFSAQYCSAPKWIALTLQTVIACTALQNITMHSTAPMHCNCNCSQYTGKRHCRKNYLNPSDGKGNTVKKVQSSVTSEGSVRYANWFTNVWILFIVGKFWMYFQVIVCLTPGGASKWHRMQNFSGGKNPAF